MERVNSEKDIKEAANVPADTSVQGNPRGQARGFASMNEEKQREIASMGGKSQGKDNNPGNFANDPERASEAGKKGGSR